MGSTQSMHVTILQAKRSSDYARSRQGRVWISMAPLMPRRARRMSRSSYAVVLARTCYVVLLSRLVGRVSAQDCTTLPPDSLPTEASWIDCQLPVPGSSATPAPSSSTCQAMCDAGWATSGSMTAYCRTVAGFAEWSVRSDTFGCMPLPCSSPPVDPNLDANAHWDCPSMPLASGGSCTAECNPGFFKSAIRTISCSLGSWDAPSGSMTCYPTTCNSLPDAAALDPNASWNCPSLPVAVGSSCTAECNAGYTTSGSHTVLCSMGSWDPPTGTLTCSPKPCSNTPGPAAADTALPANAVYQCPESTANCGTCSASCKAGFSSVGSRFATCSTGSWVAHTGSLQCSPSKRGIGW